MQLLEGCIAQEKSFGPRSRCCQCKIRAIRDNIVSVKELDGKFIQNIRWMVIVLSGISQPLNGPIDWLHLVQ